jgi:hypothetical protein
MEKILNKIIKSLRQEGLFRTLQKILLKFFTITKIIHTKKILNLASIEDRFLEIYKTNYWDNTESSSGSGSTILYTENLRSKLPELIKKYSIKSILDAPCGDFNWMQKFLKNNPTIYVGGDIVQPLIDLHIKNYQTDKIRFQRLDITQDKLPKMDMMICRDCLFHLSYSDTKSFLLNFINSEIPYLLTSTHINDGDLKNRDIISADFKQIDLFSSPYNFSKNVLFRIEDWMSPDPRREMCLWNRDQIIEATSKFNF